MEKSTRNAIEHTTQRARRLLEDEFADQLEGTFDILRDGRVGAGSSRMPAADQARRQSILAALDRKRANGMDARQALTDYLRDAAFTTLNRFVALKMLEARELLQECVTKGEQSNGYVEFTGLAPGLALLPDGRGYRLYLESLFDELSTEIKVLFDRRDPASVLWPRRAAFGELLDALNASELAEVWAEDETIGWLYQFFNSAGDRQAARYDASGRPKPPQNSRELAVRNQFFTPRYVVQFLVDNTLGRTWMEMTGGRTRLAESCEYLVRPTDEPLGSRVPKDPRDLRILDPACGSGHFLLYAFDLLLTIYEEAWAFEEAPASEQTTQSLRADYPDLAELRRQAPRLIIEHNLYGVDIDARCAQIAALALWLRAQRSYRDLGLKAAARPRITRTHIVIAEPMPGDKELAAAFAKDLQPPFVAALFQRMVQEMRLAGELGTLLQVEKSLANDIRRARQQFLESDQQTMFAELLTRSDEKKLSLSGVTDMSVFHDAERRILSILAQFATSAASDARRRLFAGDAAQGIAMVELVQTRFDVMLMNPPFGLPPTGASDAYIRNRYPDAVTEVSVAFARRASELLHGSGLLGAVAPRSWMLRRRLARFRADQLLPELQAVLDLGNGVLDAAIDIAGYVLEKATKRPSVVMIDRRGSENREAIPALSDLHGHHRAQLGSGISSRIVFGELASGQDDDREWTTFQPAAGVAIGGLRTFQDARFVRLWWEVDSSTVGSTKQWRWWARTDGYSTFIGVPLAVLNWTDDGRELQAVNLQLNGSTAQVRQGSVHFGRPGLHVMWRSERLCPRLLPAGCAFSSAAPVVLPTETGDVTLVLGWLVSEFSRTAVERNAHAKVFTPGLIKELPWAAFEQHERQAVEEAVGRVVMAKAELLAPIERYPTFAGSLPLLAEARSAGHSLAEAAEIMDRREVELKSLVIDGVRALNASISEWAGPATNIPAEPSAEAIQDHLVLPDRLPWRLALLQHLLGLAFGRWSPETETPSVPLINEFLLEPHPWPSGAARGAPVILHDDPGHPRDIVRALEDALALTGVVGDLESVYPVGVRRVVRTELFQAHLTDYSALSRRAPIYWQLSTPSGRYSVWIYYPAVTRDTLLAVLNDLVLPKLAVERRRLDDLQRPDQRSREVEAQVALVDELSSFAAELRLVVGMWRAHSDDGVIVNLAPLWRLTPAVSSFQTQLRTVWLDLEAGGHDWAHMAMHLWPERVVPKCATDRSLAIAHGLEDVFWVEAADGKWISRAHPTRSVEDLVAERTSPAVKAALADLLDAPAPAGGAGRGRKKAR